MLDNMIKEGSPTIPENVLRAQQDRFSVYAKISISFPLAFPPGDGDGVSSCLLSNVIDLMHNNDPIEADFVCFYQELQKMIGQEVRCRLVGFDTQEVDIPVNLKNSPTSRNVGVPQPFAKMGTDFLTAQLLEIKGDIPNQDAVLDCDCYGIDLYGRLLVDIRSAHNRNVETEPQRQPLNRFEMAERFLANGVAHPTYGGYIDNNLLLAFRSAQENKKGAYGDPEGRDFVHPSVYRAARRALTVKIRKRNRPEYHE